MQRKSFLSYLKHPVIITVFLLIAIGSFHLILLRSESFWRFCYFYSTPPIDDRIRLESQLKTMSASTKNKILLLGASQVREALDVEYLNDKFKFQNVRFYNLGYSGARPIDQFMNMKRILAKEPVLIIYMLNIGSFNLPYDFAKLKYSFNPEILPFFCQYLEEDSLKKKNLFLLDSYLSKISFLYRLKEPLARVLFNFMLNFSGISERSEPISFRFPTDNNEKHFARKMKNIQVGRYTRSHFTELNKELFSQYTEEIINRDIPLIVIDGPTYPQFHKIFNSEPLYDEYQEFIKKEKSRLGFTYLPNSKLPEFTKKEFADFYHLNKSGRQKLSLFLENYLQTHYFMRH